MNNSSLLRVSFAGLVAVARSLNPIPSRTRPLNSSAPMVLCLKTWESRSLPGLPRTKLNTYPTHTKPRHPRGFAVSGDSHKRSHKSRATQAQHGDAGWSSPVARQAHNLKVVSSNLAPATIFTCDPPRSPAGFFVCTEIIRIPARSP